MILEKQNNVHYNTKYFTPLQFFYDKPHTDSAPCYMHVK